MNENFTIVCVVIFRPYKKSIYEHLVCSFRCRRDVMRINLRKGRKRNAKENLKISFTCVGTENEEILFFDLFSDFRLFFT